MESKWTLIKQDIKRYCDNPDYSKVYFPKGESNACYILKLLIHLFGFRGRNQCFRTIFYYRLGTIGKIIGKIFPPRYKTTTIDCPHVVGGYLFLPSLWNDSEL